jgi:hypothetical protein
MKTVFLSFLLLLIFAFEVNAQWTATSAGLERFVQTTVMGVNNIKAVRIGNNGYVFPKAALHVDAISLSATSNPSLTFLAGEVFRTDGPGTNVNAWRLWTTDNFFNASEKFALYVKPSSIDVNLQASEPDSRFTLRTGGATQRMIVTQNSLNEPRIGIGNMTNPMAFLHLGEQSIVGYAGYRQWMDVGVLMYLSYGYGGIYNSVHDNMYVGLKPDSLDDRTDAVINWGNNPVGTNYVDRLRFIFTSHQGTGLNSADENGLEVGRMVSDGNFGYFGIGDFETLGSEPTHTLDVLGHARIREMDPALPGFHVVCKDANGVLFEGPALNALTTNIGAQNGTSLVTVGGTQTIELGLNPLLHNSEIPLNDFNLFFTDAAAPTPGTNIIRVGNTLFPTSAKFTIDNATEEITLGARTMAPQTRRVMHSYFEGVATLQTNGEILYGVLSRINGNFQYDPTIKNMHVAVGGVITNDSPYPNVAVRGSVEHSGTSYATNSGGEFRVYSSSDMIDNNRGVVGTAYNGNNNYGGVFIATGNVVGANQSDIAIGVWGSAYTADFIAGVRGTEIYPNDVSNNSYAGYFDGDISLSGIIQFSSDSALKINESVLSNSLDILKELKPVSFNWDTLNYPYMCFAGGLHYGLISQEVEPILPSLVSTVNLPAEYDTAGVLIHPDLSYKTLNYNELIPITISSLIELDSIVEADNSALNNRADSLEVLIYQLQEQILLMQDQLDRCCLANSEKAQIQSNFSQSVTLSDQKAIVLNQNMPNPFKEQTTITFQIPENVQSAVIVFVDNNGNILRQVEIEERGIGELIVYAQDLSSGIYTYYLMADDEMIDSKKMSVIK